MNDPKIIKAWSMYDWANSAYNLIVTSAIFPSYYTGIVAATVWIGGVGFPKASIASWSISLAYLIVAFISPILSAIADSRGNKKSFMRFFSTLGALSCIALFGFRNLTPEAAEPNANIWYGVFFSMVACIGFCGSLVFYNAFLPEIATKDHQDKVSARGFIMGYIGSVTLLIICLAMIMGFKDFNKAHNQILVRLSFVLVGLWWLGFSMITFKVLKDKPVQVREKTNFVKEGFRKLWQVLHEILPQRELFIYLASFFFATMGIQTTMYMATYFAADVINMPTENLIITVLLIQLLAIGGAWVTAKASEKFGNYKVLIVLLMIWVGICISARSLVYTINQFYLLASVVGIVMGGSQSIARSTYSKLLKPEVQDNASYFSFYDFVEKIGIVVGTGTFGLVAAKLGMRNSAGALGIYFTISIIILLFIIRNNRRFLVQK